MSTIQRVAQIFGWVFVVIAVWGFVVSGASMESDPAMAPKVMGLFPVNVLHNLVHLAFGVWGIMASRSVDGAKSYALGAGVIYLVLTILGFLTPTTFGLIPIGGNDIWLHALIAVVLLGAWAASRSATTAPTTETAATTAPAEPRTPPPGTTGTARPTTEPPARGIGTSPTTEPGPSGRPATGGPTPPPAPPPSSGGTDRPPSPPRPPSSGEGDRRP